MRKVASTVLTPPHRTGGGNIMKTIMQMRLNFFLANFSFLGEMCYAESLKRRERESKRSRNCGWYSRAENMWAMEEGLAWMAKRVFSTITDSSALATDTAGPYSLLWVLF